MNRPKKNKIKNPTLPDDQQTDERNLIDADDSEELSFEDRIHLYWMENKAFISGCIVVVALLIIGFNGMKIYVNYAEGKIQSAYNEAVTNDTLDNFAAKYSDKPLGGLAALEVADAAYVDEDYAKAAEYYGIAVKADGSDILVGRAKLGLAFSTFHNGSKDEGLAQLRTVAADGTLADAIRAEAAYHLAIEADVAGDEAAFESYASQVTESATASQWQRRMQMYQMQR